MLNRRKVAAGLGGLTLMLGTIGGGIAVHAASPAASPPAVVQPAAQADTETADGPDTGTDQDQQGTQVEDTTPDTGTGTEAKGGLDTDNVQSGSGSQTNDGKPDVPGAVSP